MWLFGIISLVEMQMLRIIREFCPENSWKNYLKEKRIAYAENIYKDRAKKNEQIDLAECIQFCDKREIILKDENILTEFRELSIQEIKKLLEEAEEIRNMIAHSQDFLNGYWPRIVDIINDLLSFLKKCENINSINGISSVNIEVLKDKNEDIILEETKKIIRRYSLPDYLKRFPWLTGYIGDINSKIWFVGENPSLRGVENVDKKNPIKDVNLQKNSHVGDWLFRDALTECGLKTGAPRKNEGWNCYITNAIKLPEIVVSRNKEKNKNKDYLTEQINQWMPLLQLQINLGKPKVLVAMGKTVLNILEKMKRLGLNAPELDIIPHYSYIMFRPDQKRKLGPRDPIRIKEFKEEVKRIKEKYF